MLTPAYTPTVTASADLGAAPVAVLAQTRSGESSRALQGSVVLTGLDGSGSILTLTRSVGAVSSRAVEVEAPIGVTALELPMAAFVARDDGTIGMTVGSDNAADDDVDVTVTLWPAAAGPGVRQDHVSTGTFDPGAGQLMMLAADPGSSNDYVGKSVIVGGSIVRTITEYEPPEEEGVGVFSLNSGITPIPSPGTAVVLCGDVRDGLVRFDAAKVADVGGSVELDQEGIDAIAAGVAEQVGGGGSADVLQHRISSGFVFRSPSRESESLIADNTIKLNSKTERPRIGFDVSALTKSVPVGIDSIEVFDASDTESVGLVVLQPSDAANVGVRDFLLMTKVSSAPTAGTYRVQITFTCADGAQLETSGRVVVP